MDNQDKVLDALKKIATQACREWCYDKNNYCYAPAEVVLWGKLLKPEALGPRCYDHAAKHVGHALLSSHESAAMVDLRPALAILREADPQAKAEDERRRLINGEMSALEAEDYLVRLEKESVEIADHEVQLRVAAIENELRQ